MAIVSVVVHPKGATHVQDLGSTNYFLKFVDGIWHFFALNTWLKDDILNNPSEGLFGYSSKRVKPLR